MGRIIAVCVIVLLCGCTGTAIMHTPAAPVGQAIGNCEATAGGFSLFGFIPIMQNDRFQRAYDECVGSLGARALANITIRERWYWTPAGDGMLTTISGTAVR